MPSSSPYKAGTKLLKKGWKWVKGKNRPVKVATDTKKKAPAKKRRTTKRRARR